MDNEVVNRQHPVSDEQNADRTPFALKHDTHEAGYCSADVHDRGRTTSVTADIERLWPKLEAGIRYLRNR